MRKTYRSHNDFGVTTSASKRKWRKPKMIKGYIRWCGQHQETKRAVARMARKSNSIAIIADTRILETPDQGKQSVATNRCGNDCGRRAVKGDYLCSRCR